MNTESASMLQPPQQDHIVRSTTRRWYATAPFSKYIYIGHEADVVPLGVIHAKETGTDTSACGIDVSTWPRMWSINFVTSPYPRCTACERAIINATAGRPATGRPDSGSAAAAPTVNEVRASEQRADIARVATA